MSEPGTAVRSVAESPSEAAALHAIAQHLDKIGARIENGAARPVVHINRSTIGLLITVLLAFVLNLVAVTRFGTRIDTQVQGLGKTLEAAVEQLQRDNREMRSQLNNHETRVGRIEGRIDAGQ